MSFCPKNRLLFCCEFLQLLFQAANVPHPFLATGSGRAHKSLKHTNHDLEAVLASGSMTKCEPTWYHHHVKFWDVFGPNQNRNRQKWKPPSSPFLSTQDLDLIFSPSCNDEVIVDVPRIQTLHRFIELTPQDRFNCRFNGELPLSPTLRPGTWFECAATLALPTTRGSYKPDVCFPNLDVSLWD